jgi:hypothetical protein
MLGHAREDHRGPSRSESWIKRRTASRVTGADPISRGAAHHAARIGRFFSDVSMLDFHACKFQLHGMKLQEELSLKRALGENF